MYLLLPLAALWLGGQVSELDQGVALVTQGHADQAIPLLLRATSAKPEDAVAWKALGVGYASMGQYDLAEPAFGQACRLASKLADACYFQARALYALNRFEASLATMRKAGTGARVRLGEGQALEALGRFEDAEKALREAAALARADDPGPAVALGLMLLRSGRPHEAEASLAKTVLAHPGSSDAHICLARALLERSAVDLAIPHLERAVALTPTSAQAHLLLAKAYMRKGRAQDAQPHFDAAARSAQ